MPFDPNLPANNSALSSLEMRGQLNGLKDLIDALQSINAAQVDAVDTVDPGTPAAVVLTVNGNTLNFSFTIPSGANGADGINGSNGADGGSVTGAVMDSVTTMNPGDPATAGVTWDGANVRFTLGIPRGNDGVNGNDGTNGSDGGVGPPGEVTSSQLNTAIDGTSDNSNNVTMLGLTVSDPPTQGEMQDIANKLDELILALRR